MAEDPLRSLSREPVRVTVGGHELTLPWHPALTWLETVRRDEGRLALAMSDDPSDVVMALALGELSPDAVRDVSHEMLEAETGQRWWVARKLAYISASPTVLGEMTLAGVDPTRVSFGMWCAAVYRILTRNCDAKEKSKIEFELELPPDGYEEAWDDGNDFDALVEKARRYEQQS